MLNVFLIVRSFNCTVRLTAPFQRLTGPCGRLTEPFGRLTEPVSGTVQLNDHIIDTYS